MNIKKLTVREFARAVKLGHGRAILHVLHHGDKGMEKIIEQALLKSYVYDWQIEGSRAGWLMCLLQATGRLAFYVRKFLNQHSSDSYGGADLAQQILLAGRLFEIGFSELRSTVLEKYTKLLVLSPFHAGCGSEIVDMAGNSGLEFVARSIGEQVPEPDAFDCAFILERANDLCGNSDGEELLRRLAESEPAVQKFLDAAASLKNSSNLPSAPRPVIENFQEILDLIDKRAHAPEAITYVAMGRRINDEVAASCFKLLLASDDTWVQLVCLRLLGSRKLPDVTPYVIELLESEDKLVASACFHALRNKKDSRIREVAVRWLQSEDQVRISRTIRLLECNFISGDEEIFFEKLPLLKDDDLLPSAGIPTEDWLPFVSRDVGLKLLFWFYENGPDSWCRSNFFEKLVELEACPDELIYESQWDCAERTQNLARCLLAKKEGFISKC
ncbi:MAG: hypothetical protein KGS72_00125 [Cyanobacteria bacterium REEB67]|nr:hypothetical protein [Cyanobacteria bacterium REEB67]